MLTLLTGFGRCRGVDVLGELTENVRGADSMSVDVVDTDPDPIRNEFVKRMFQEFGPEREFDDDDVLAAIRRWKGLSPQLKTFLKTTIGLTDSDFVDGGP
jgi:hypothetical protein